MDHFSWQLAILISGGALVVYGVIWRVFTKQTLSVLSKSPQIVSEANASTSQSHGFLLAQAAGMAIGGLCTDFICKMLGTMNGRRTIVMTGMSVSAIFGLLAVNVSSMNQVAICLSISMAALGACEGVFWTTATDIGRASGGFSAAFMNTGGNVGGLISPVLTPVLAEQMGWPGAIAFACVIAGVGGLVWFFIRPTEQLLLD